MKRTWRKRRGRVHRRWTERRYFSGRAAEGSGWGSPEGLEAGWASLQQECQDRAGRARLMRLFDRLTKSDRGARESALAELELAVLFMRGGCSVSFLPESQARTADLECRHEGVKFFVEVTALVGGLSERSRPAPNRPAGPPSSTETEPDAHVLIRRLLARIAQKARQLCDYREPVVLALTVPRRDMRADELDLKRLAGAMTLLLPLIRHISGILLSLWDVEPAPSRSGIRLSHVHLVERSVHQRAYPRVRMLVTNPSAASPLGVEQVEVLRGLL